MAEGDKHASGLQLNFFESDTLEKVDESDSPTCYEVLGRNVLRLLMMGWNANWSDLLSWQTFHAIFIERDHQLTKGMRLAFQKGFDHIFTQLQGKELSDQQRNQALFYISNCLTILPYADLTLYESFKIPQWIDDAWEMVEYKVVPIELTPTSGFKKLFLSDEDRVFAYGLEPMNHPNAEPHLIFMGTTYPAGQGFVTQVNTDLEGFETAGKKLYRTGHERIRHWLEQQQKKVHVCGTSLGGALSLLLAIDQGDKLSRVDALNPPGLYHPWKKSRFDHWETFGEQKPQVFVQRQADDPISQFGVWKEDWTILHVTPPTEKKGPNGVSDHVLNYAGFAKTEFIEIDAKKDNEARWHQNFWMYALLRSLFYYVVLVPFRYTILPVFRYVFTHKVQMLILAAATVLFCLMPGLASGFVIPQIGAAMLLVFNIAFSAVTAAYLVNDLLWLVSDLLRGTWESDIAKAARWIFSQTMPVKVSLISFSVAAVLAVAAFAVSALFIPALMPLVTATSVLIVVAVPLALKFLVQIAEVITTLFGLNVPETPKCQHPSLPRNEALDIYANTTTLEFSLKDLGNYYRARRCLLNNKEFLPDSDQQVETTSEKSLKTNFNGTSKRDLLAATEDEQNEKTLCMVEGSKAKINHMKKTVQLINQFSFRRDNLVTEGPGNQSFIQKLQELDVEYTCGKTAKLGTSS